MPSFTLEQLSNAGGWAVALLLALALIGLLLRGDLVPRSAYESQTKRGDATDKVMAELLPLIRDIAAAGKVTAVQMDFLVDFVKDTLRSASVTTIGETEVGVIRWLQHRLGIDEARAAEERTRRLAAELHEAIVDTAAAARSRVRAVGRQDWPRLYRERLDDRADR